MGRNRSSRLSLSEILTIMVHFHQSHYRDFTSSTTTWITYAPSSIKTFHV
jgi:hypothetical protein